MNELSFETKIKLNSGSQIFNYLALKNGSFLIYTTNEIIIFYKNLNFKKLFLHNDNEELKIKFIKNINNEKFLCLNNKNLYIFTIKSDIKILKKFQLEDNQMILDAIELKNGMIIAITNSNILNINVDKDKICKISEIPKECLINKTQIQDFNQTNDIYELPNNNILIHSHLYYEYYQNEGCIRGDLYYNKNKEVIFNIDKCKVIHCLVNFDHENEFSYASNFDKSKILIYKKYICISKKTNIKIYNISDYEFIKEISGLNLKIFNYDENMIFATYYSYNDRNEQFALLDITDINKIKYQKIIFDKEIIPNKCYLYIYDDEIIKIKKYSDEKLLVIYDKNIFIFKFNKKLDLLLYNDLN